jgi:hypothetical protein
VSGADHEKTRPSSLSGHITQNGILNRTEFGIDSQHRIIAALRNCSIRVFQTMPRKRADNSAAFRNLSGPDIP